MHEDERNAINYLRKQGAHYLTKHYDTDYNMLRWAQAYDYNLDEASFHLLRHLKYRLFYGLDQADKIPDHEVLKKYFPLGLVGSTGLNNTLLVVEHAGRIDLQGIMRAVPTTTFLVGRYKFQEHMLNCINRVERETGKQSSVFYLLDLEGLKFDSKLLSTVTGPYRILWAAVYTNYPEWISYMYIINAPSFMSILWKAIGPMLPQRTREKVRIFSSRNDWKPAVDLMADPDFVPQHWGGTLVDANGDTMCRFVDRTYGMAIYYSSDPEAENSALEDMDDWLPPFDYPYMPSVDLLKAKLPGPGIVKIKFNNEQSWFRSMTVHYRVRFVNEMDQAVTFRQINL